MSKPVRKILESFSKFGRKSIKESFGEEVANLDISVSPEDRSRFDEVIKKHLSSIDPNGDLDIKEAVDKLSEPEQQSLKEDLSGFSYVDAECMTTSKKIGESVYKNNVVELANSSDSNSAISNLKKFGISASLVPGSKNKILVGDGKTEEAVKVLADVSIDAVVSVGESFSTRNKLKRKIKENTGGYSKSEVLSKMKEKIKDQDTLYKLSDALDKLDDVELLDGRFDAMIVTAAISDLDLEKDTRQFGTGGGLIMNKI